MHSVDRHRHEAFGNLVVSASDGAAALIVVVTLRRELCLQTEAWRRSNCAASRSSIGSRTMTTQMVVDGDFSPTAIAAHLRQHPRGFGRRLSRERQRAKHTMRVRARTERERVTDHVDYLRGSYQLTMLKLFCNALEPTGCDWQLAASGSKFARFFGRPPPIGPFKIREKS